MWKYNICCAYSINGAFCKKSVNVWYLSLLLINGIYYMGAWRCQIFQALAIK